MRFDDALGASPAIALAALLALFMLLVVTLSGNARATA